MGSGELRRTCGCLPPRIPSRRGEIGRAGLVGAQNDVGVAEAYSEPPVASLVLLCSAPTVRAELVEASATVALHSKSPVASFVEPCSLYVAIMLRAMVWRWTSSAPSTRRAERAWRIMRSSGVSVEYPRAPWTWMARSTLRQRVFAT